MPTQLTDPVVKFTATQATLDRWALTVGRGFDGVSVEPVNTVMDVELCLRDANGKVVEIRKLSRAVTDLPQPLRAAARTFHAALMTAMRNAGLLPPGIDTDDIPGN